MSNLLNQHLPTRRVSRHTSDNPWVTDYFRQLIFQCQRAFISGDIREHRILRNKVVSTANTIRSSYHREQLSFLRDCDPHRNIPEPLPA